LNVRKAIDDDAGPIADIYNQAINDPDYISAQDLVPVTPENRRAWLADPRISVFVLEAHDRQIAGWSVIVPFAFRPQFDNTAQSAVFMDRRFRSGLGGVILFLHAVRTAYGLGYRRMINFVHANNTPSVRATQRLFQGPTLTIKNAVFFRGRWDDELVFCRELNASEDPVLERYFQRFVNRGRPDPGGS